MNNPKHRINANLEVEGEVEASGINLNTEIDLLKNLIPQGPEPLDGLAFESVDSGVQSGGVADDSDPAHYGYDIAPGDTGVMNIIQDSTPTILTVNTTKFGKADQGFLKLFINGDQKDSMDLSVETPSATSIELVSRVVHNDFEPFQRGQARILIGTGTALLSPGVNQVRLVHEIEGATYGEAVLVLFYDSGVSAPAIDPANSSVVMKTAGTGVFLSGVKYLGPDGMVTVNLKATGIFANSFHPTPVTVEGTETGFDEDNIPWDDGAGFSSPPLVSDNWDLTRDYALDGSQVFSRDGRVQATARDPFSESSPVNLPRANKLLVNTKGQKSTEIMEEFVDEVHRLPEALYDSIPSLITNQWDSSNPLINGHAQVAGALLYPSEDYSAAYDPSAGQPDYSVGFSGDQVYLRAIRDDSNPHSNGILQLIGLTVADLTGDLKVEIKLPGVTGWLDLGSPYDAGAFTGANGDGCRTAVNGDQFSWTAGTFSTAQSGYMIIVRVTLTNTAASGKLTGLQAIGW